jgi:NADPH:quinone reductase-like Zn-dependent oxidoreductase
MTDIRVTGAPSAVDASPTRGRTGTAGQESKMKAIVRDSYGPATEVLELRDVGKPVVGDNDVLVKVHAAGIHAGIWHVVEGKPYIARVMGFGVLKPKNPGVWSDVAGTVEAVGANVTRFKPGDEVLGECDKGAFAEYAAANQKKFQHKPANVTFEQAAASTISGITALQAVRGPGGKGRGVQPGDKVLVIGAGGGVGSFAVQIAKAAGAHVTGVCSTAKVDLVRSLGADAVVDYTRDDFADGTRYDVILAIAGNRPLSHLRRALAPKGTLVNVGSEDGGPLTGGMGRNVLALVLLPLWGRRFRWLIALHRPDDHSYLTQLIADGKVTPAIDRTYPLPDMPEAVRYVQERRSRGKVAVTI